MSKPMFSVDNKVVLFQLKAFWVAARTGNGLCAGSSCTSTHFVFEDDGPAFDASNYSPWLGLKVTWYT